MEQRPHTRHRVVAAGVVGAGLLILIAAVCVLSLMLAECLGGDPECYGYADRRTVVTLALPLVAAAVLTAGVFGAARARRARPLVLADAAMFVLFWVWWTLPGWSPLVLGALVVIVSAAAVTALSPQA